jgi:hypothetical protein
MEPEKMSDPAMTFLVVGILVIVLVCVLIGVWLR